VYDNVDRGVFWSCYQVPSTRFNRKIDITFRLLLEKDQVDIDYFDHAFLNYGEIDRAFAERQVFEKYPILDFVRSRTVRERTHIFKTKAYIDPLSKTLWNIVKDVASLKEHPRW
jgi:hypothetical protein